MQRFIVHAAGYVYFECPYCERCVHKVNHTRDLHLADVILAYSEGCEQLRLHLKDEHGINADVRAQES